MIRLQRSRTASLLFIPFLLGVLPAAGSAQDRLRQMPGYERHARLAPQIAGSVRSGALAVTWAADGRSLEYDRDGRRIRYDFDTGAATEVLRGDTAGAVVPRPRPERGRQLDHADSPDGRLRAFHRDRDVWIASSDGTDERRITSDGSVERRIKNGTASWVYGEELGQSTALWWSPDGRKLAYYRFDESRVPDYFLQLDQTRLQSTVDVEAYPKAGVDNPIVDLFVHDLESGVTTRIDVRDGREFSNDVLGHYVYRVGWSPGGRELTFNRTNRRQNTMELTACSPTTGACRVVVREHWPASWTQNSPTIIHLADGQRFLWMSERTGFRNIYLYDLRGRLLTTITQHPFEVASIVRVDETRNTLWYMARSGDNHMKLQLHRVGLDGRGDVRLTDPAFHHSVEVAPDGAHFVAVSQTHRDAPVTRLHDANGRMLAQLASSDLGRFEELALLQPELFTYTSADGVTELHGMLHRPSNFDPAQRYPLLVSIYGGPGSTGARETFVTPHAYTEYGFLVVTIDLRSAGGRGKRFLDAIYQKLGVVEVDDVAAAVRALRERPYVDGERVGIFGTSYGGYVALMTLLRHPDEVHAAVASSPVTDWRHYDTIYTERYMGMPQENTAGYDAGSAMSYVDNLRGRLMIYYGTADNNVHPSNALELIAALQRAGKSFEVQVGPDRGHTSINAERMMEFFIDNLVLRPGARPASTVEQR